MNIAFQKMHANGDDFVVVDWRGRAEPFDSRIVKRMGDRHRGIGFNQLALVTESATADALVAFWNADGSNLNTCGSATRGVASLLMKESGKTSVLLHTAQGSLSCSVAKEGLISVSMGVPGLAWQNIPLSQSEDTLRLPLPGEPAACSMGNPHCTFFVDDVAAVAVEEVGPSIEAHSLFPLKTNVHFVQVLSRTQIRLRIWERGGGVPLGSGSCCCGAVVNGIRRGLLNVSDQIEVVCDGGSVFVRWDGGESDVLLTGPVELLYSGNWTADI